MRQESTASDHDRQAVTEAIQVNQNNSWATTQAHMFSGLASDYRVLVAESDAVRATDEERANLLKSVADSYGLQARIFEFMTGYKATSTFDIHRQSQALLHQTDVLAIGPDQPQRTAALADREHDQAQRLSLSVVGMLVVVVALTGARLARRRPGRLVLVGGGVCGFLGALALAAAQVL